MKDQCERLIVKSKEAFMSSINRLNNKDSTYRTESICIFLCNAWELMLKAYLLKKGGYEKICYKRKGSFIVLSECINRVFTNEQDPLREDLKIIKDNRNLAIHFVINKEQEFLQYKINSCIVNFINKMRDFHEIYLDECKKKIENMGITIIYNKKRLFKEINKTLSYLKINFSINNQIFNLFNQVYKLNENKIYCVVEKKQGINSYRYTQSTVYLIVEEIKQHPNIVDFLKVKIKIS